MKAPGRTRQTQGLRAACSRPAHEPQRPTQPALEAHELRLRPGSVAADPAPAPGRRPARSAAAGLPAADLRGDLAAGLVVGVVALPLSMALAIATGVPPQNGLYTAIVAGALIALLGGSRVQVCGPTAAFVVILAPIAVRFGLGGLLVATLLAGGLQAAMGLARLGRLIQFIPYPVTTGFTAGIAVVIATLQVKDFLGLQVEALPEHFLRARRGARPGAADGALAEVLIGAGTLAVLILWPRVVTPTTPGAAGRAHAGAPSSPGARAPGPGLRGRHDRRPLQLRDSRACTQGIPRLPPLPLLPWAPAGAGRRAAGALARARARRCWRRPSRSPCSARSSRCSRRSSPTA